MFTVTELAHYLKVSEDTVERLIKSGSLKAAKVGKQWRVSEDQLQEYLDSRTIKKRKLTI